MQDLEVVNNKGARMITGCLRSTKIESLLLEANLFPVKVSCDIKAAIAVEKYKRFDVSDPLYVTASKKNKKGRLKKTAKSWKHSGEGVLNSSYI